MTPYRPKPEEIERIRADLRLRRLPEGPFTDILLAEIDWLRVQNETLKREVETLEALYVEPDK